MTGLLLTLVLAADPADAPEVGSDANASPRRAVVRTETPLDRDALREWYFELAPKTTKRSRMPADEAVPQLVALHELVGAVEGVSSVEKQRMRATLRGRLEWYGHRLRKRVATAERAQRRRGSTNTAAGPASIAGARSLIDLVQRTVDPPIWDVNGGPASIGYFDPCHALVVRAPGEVHVQLGGALGQLRRAGN